MSSDCVEALADLDWIHPRNMMLILRNLFLCLKKIDVNERNDEEASKGKYEQNLLSKNEQK